VGRIATFGLGVLVAALVASALWARWAPRPGVRTHGPQDRVVRVQVLNGSGEGGVGRKVATALREGGFHVVEVTNADRFDYFTTMVVARRDDDAAARAVARYLGGPPVIRQAWDADLADVTVVLGSDRSQLKLE
jgi:hypothetical protein